MWALYVWALYVCPLYVSTPLCETEKYEFSGRMLTPCMCEHAKRTKISTKSRLQFMGRMLRNTEKYENHQEKSTWVRAKNVKKARVLL